MNALFQEEVTFREYLKLGLRLSAAGTTLLETCCSFARPISRHLSPPTVVPSSKAHEICMPLYKSLQ